MVLPETLITLLHPRRMEMEEFPAKTDEIAGIAWLPRLIVKARAKLEGALPADLMYG